MDKLECLLRTETTRSPVWLSNESIAYIRVGDGGPRVWEMNLVTGVARQRTFGDERIWSIKGHPQTGSIIFCMDEGGNEREQIYLLEQGSSKPRDLTGKPESRHFLGGLSPDSGTLSFASNEQTPETFDIWICDVATGEKKMVLQNSDHYNWPAADALSPDGRYLLYNKLLGTSDNALWMVDLTCGKAVRVPGDERVSAEVHPCLASRFKWFFCYHRSGQ